MTSYKFFQWNLLATESPDYCVIHARPRGLGAEDYRLGKGEAIADIYPADARIEMSDEETGIELPSFVGNTVAMLLVERSLNEVLKGVCGTEGFEYLPVSIFDHKGGLASSDYFIVNPLHRCDCLDHQKSVVKYSGQKVISVKKMVIDPDKAKALPPLFRLQERPQTYIVTATLVRALVAMKPRPSNVLLIPLPTSEDA